MIKPQQSEPENKKTRKNFGLSYTSVKRHTRKKRKNGKTVIVPIGYSDNSTGRRLNSKTQKRLETFYIPPAYNNDDILIAKSVNNKVQVICEDTAGRKQYIYHPKYLAGKERRKYNKLSALAKYAYHIERDAHNTISRLASHAPSKKPYDKDILTQIVLYILITHHFRIGCREYEKEYGSTGISTLQPKHIKISPGGKEAKFRFKGKKGVINNCVETWEPAIKVILRLCNQHLPALREEIKGDPDIDNQPVHLFSYIYTNPIADRKGMSIITSQDVACYLATKYGKDAIISPKMFRTWYANYHMLDYLRTKPPSNTAIKIRQWISELDNGGNSDIPSSINDGKHGSKHGKHGKVDPVSEKKQMAWLKKEIPNYVSQHLNNTPSVCKSDYINNRLFQDVIKRPEYYRKRALAATTPSARHKLVAQVLA